MNTCVLCVCVFVRGVTQLQLLLFVCLTEVLLMMMAVVVVGRLSCFVGDGVVAERISLPGCRPVCVCVIVLAGLVPRKLGA